MRCPICKEILKNDDKRYYCINNHSYDISKSGYVNLLLNSKNSGDNKLMVEARKSFLDKDYYHQLRQKIVDIIKELNVSNIIDVGCGEGYYDSYISKMLNVSLVGIDISKNACHKASIRDKLSKYVVASSKMLPFDDNGFDLLLNIFAPHNESEFSRVCNKYMIKVVPGKNHLLQLKELLYSNILIKEEKLLDYSKFKLIKRFDLIYNINVSDLYELFMMTPYFYKTKYDIDIFENNKNIDITCDFIILLYEKDNK